MTTVFPTGDKEAFPLAPRRGPQIRFLPGQNQNHSNARVLQSCLRFVYVRQNCSHVDAYFPALPVAAPASERAHMWEGPPVTLARAPVNSLFLEGGLTT